MAGNYYGFTHTGTQYGGNYIPSMAPPVTNAGLYAGPSGHQQMYMGQRFNSGYDQSYTAGSIPTEYPYSSRSATMTTGYPTNDGGHYVGHTQAQQPSSGPYGYNVQPNQQQGYTNTYNSVVSDYAATSLNTYQDAPTESNVLPVYSNTANGNNWAQYKKNTGGFAAKTNSFRGKPAPKPQQLHYCDVCKISCAGPQTYKEHLDGQRHKKKEAVTKASPAAAIKRGPAPGLTMHCELCDITCTGNEAYASHVRGSKHQKVLKLHTKLGKPIPPQEPVLINPKGNPVAKASGAVPQIPAAAGKIKVMGTPCINFLTGGRLRMAAQGSFAVDTPDEADEIVPAAINSDLFTTEPESGMPTTESSLSTAPTPQIQVNQSDANVQQQVKNDIQPVGQDYVEEVHENGKPMIFNCKLCDCKFNDPNAKEMHIRGRRHRLQYKKKVDPTLAVEIKPSLKQRQKVDTKQSRYFNNQQVPYSNDTWYGQNYGVPPQMGQQEHFEPPFMPGPSGPQPPHFNRPSVMLHGPFRPSNFDGPPGAPMPPMGPFRKNQPRHQSWDDSNILQKHSEIVPSEDELEEIYHVVTMTERALKLVSDVLIAEASTEHMNEVIAKEIVPQLTSQKPLENLNGDAETKLDEFKPDRVLKGLMRVGLLSKSLLLSGDREVDLVVICSEIPTRKVLERVTESLPHQLQVVAPSETYQVVMMPQDAGLMVSSTTEPKIRVNIALTSQAVRDLGEGNAAEMVKDPKQMLDRQKCLEALAALRHAKWYQARVANFHPCPLVIRIFRDLCRRISTWSALSLWAVELLCERVMSSAGEFISPAQALRHIFEAIATGIMLPGGVGLMDPCEKDPADALGKLTKQQREDITSSAQHALRLLAFRQIHKILGLELANSSRKRKTVELAAEVDSDKKSRTEVNWADDSEMSLADIGAQQFAEAEEEGPEKDA